MAHISTPAPDRIGGVRAAFPALHQQVNGKPLVYLDSAASALKPQSVVDAVAEFYTRDCANVHRAVHKLSQRATAAYEGARDKVQGFANAATREQIIFLRGTTEAINLVAQCYARPRLQPGDQILITTLEHHANIVPWQMVCEQTGAELAVVPITDEGEVTLAAFDACLSKRTKIVACSHASNTLGTVLPVADMIERAHAVGAVAVVDGAQAVPHLPVDVAALDCDFYAFSGHKLYGPTGIGVLYGKAEWLESMPPWQGGGDMIDKVTFEETTYNVPPYRFEAGTPHIAGAIGLGVAMDFVLEQGYDWIASHEAALIAHATARLATVAGLRQLGTTQDKIGVFSFVIDGAHAHDLGTLLDLEGVAIRTGHHCAQPVLQRYGINATARASLGIYNQKADIDALVEALQRTLKLLQ